MSTKGKKPNLGPIRESLMNSLERVKALLEKGAAELTLSELETRAVMVDSLFSQLNSIQSDIEQAPPEGEQADTNKREAYEELYCDVKSRIVSALNDSRRRSASASEFVHNSTVTSGTSSSAFTRIANLPKIQIPIFSGKYTEWTNWYNTFIALIDSDQDLDNLAKFIHLRAALGSVPLRAVEALELTAANYTQALKLLRTRFENKAIIFQSHMKELFEFPKLPRQNASSLRELIDRVNAHVRALDSLGSKEEIANVALYYITRSKVDPDTLKKWEDSFQCDKLPSWTLFSEFLANRCTTLENRELNASSSTNASTNEKSRRSNAVTLTANQEGQVCPSCNSSHSIAKCSTFIKLSPRQRYYEAKKHTLCILCLSDNHAIQQCKASHCSKCNGKHHTLLHRENTLSEGSNVVSPSKVAAAQSAVASDDNAETHKSEATSSNSLYNSLLVPAKIKFLATAVLLVRNSKGRFVECRAILDSGSQLNFISENMAKDLSLKVENSDAAISGIGSATTKAIGSVTTVIRSRLTNYSESLNFLLLPTITQYAPNVPIDRTQWPMPKNVQLADPKFNEAKAIDMLLGVSTFFKLLSVGQITFGRNMPILQKSLLGWILAGEYNQPDSMPLNCVANSAIDDKVLSQQVEKFWACEDIFTAKSKWSPKEQNCEDQFVSSVRRIPSGRFMVRLPFKANNPGVGRTYSIAQKRFENLERKFSRNPELKLEYVKFMEEYRTLGHLEVIPGISQNEVKYIMPHHAVLRPDSISTKLRVVFDASSKSENGCSLNDNLLVGPKIQPDLFDILVRFRFFRYAVTADIAKMYRQILVDPDDCNWQCVLWRDDRSKEIEILRLKTVTYGTSAAPYLAVRCLQFLADSYKFQFRIASQVLNRNFYMDDMLAGADSIKELSALKREVTMLLEKGKFELHKWRVSFALASDETAASLNSEPFQIPAQDCTKALGVLWFSVEDTFRFAYVAKEHSRITKRTILSELASLFDPLGLVNPVVVLGKIFLQELWMLKLDWDETLSQELHDKWQRYRQELPLVSKLSVPRYIANVFSAEIVELHGFSDASNRAYGCAIYVRAVDRGGQITVNLLTAKSRVAPLKAVSSPRLELQGAVILAQLSDRVKSCSSLKFTNVYLWTDSAIVLNWLSAHPSRWTTFVANRVALIQSLSCVADWHKIDTKSNPADIISRGMLPRDLEGCSLWFKGPEFLRVDRSLWPSTLLFDSSEDEANIEQRRVNNVLLTSEGGIEDLVSRSKFANSYFKLNRVFAFVSRWVNRVRYKRANSQSSQFPQLSIQELRMGLHYILFNVQQVSFHVEYKALKLNSNLKSLKVQALNPFIDESEGIPIIRVGGRLSKADMPYSTKHPILLPYDSAFTRCLSAWLHRVNLHVGPLALLAAIRQRFWIINGRKLTQQTVRNCMACFKNRPKVLQQRMGDLPRDRLVGKMYPFQKSGMDFAGPILIHYKLRGKRPVKAYLALFICFLTKACHLEVVSDLSTPAFLCALKRFFARRGLSTDLYCDNATNFTGAARELRRLADQCLDETGRAKIIDECASRGVNFHFIPPHSPHMGCLWESAIKVAKSMLVHHINGATLTFEEMTTVTAEIEGIMNSRPLYAMPPLNRWKRIQHIKLLFWRRWAKEYLLSLQQRTKWRSSCNNIKIGTLVLIADDNLPPGKWSLGRVETVIPGEDGLVRVVTVRTSSGVLKRNIHKIWPLPLGSDLSAAAPLEHSDTEKYNTIIKRNVHSIQGNFRIKRRIHSIQSNFYN